MADKEQVKAFLKELREKIRFFDIAFRPREKNLDFLAEIDIVPIDRIDYIKKLTFENYISGPNKDTFDTKKPNYYEFGMEIKGTEVYIKIGLGLTGKRVDCMSFHKAKMPITYPLKEDKS